MEFVNERRGGESEGKEWGSRREVGIGGKWGGLNLSKVQKKSFILRKIIRSFINKSSS